MTHAVGLPADRRLGPLNLQILARIADTPHQLTLQDPRAPATRCRTVETSTRTFSVHFLTNWRYGTSIRALRLARQPRPERKRIEAHEKNVPTLCPVRGIGFRRQDSQAQVPKAVRTPRTATPVRMPEPMALRIAATTTPAATNRRAGTRATRTERRMAARAAVRPQTHRQEIRILTARGPTTTGPGLRAIAAAASPEHNNVG